MKLDDFQERFRRVNQFYERIVKNFTEYLVPVIELAAATSKEAVCVVFEKVNTGGKPLDAFERQAATYSKGVQDQPSVAVDPQGDFVVVWSGDPLEPLSQPSAVFIDGVEQPLTSRPLLLRDRYRQQTPMPPAYRNP